MTSDSIKVEPNCASGLPLIALGVIALGTGLEGSVPSIAFGALLIVVPLCVYFLLRASVRRIAISRSGPLKAFEGDTIDVRITIQNLSRIPIFFPRVSEIFTPEAHVQKDVSFPYRVEPGETVTEGFHGDCILPRGIYGPGACALSVSDPLGWFKITARIPLQGSLKIYPRFQAVGARENLGDSLSLVLRDLTRSGLGESNEFYSIREYRHGDPLRRIHWRLSAHRGFPVVREQTRPANGDLCIVIDLYRFSLLGVGRGSSLEQAVKITASLAAHALSKGHHVEVFGNGAAPLCVPSGGGSSQLQAILDALVPLKPDGVRPLEDFLEDSARQIRQGSTVLIMVSPYLRGNAKFGEALSALARQGNRVLLVVFDDSSFRALYESRLKPCSAADYMTQMKSLGMEAFLVPCAADLRTVFGASGGRS